MGCRWEVLVCEVDNLLLVVFTHNTALFAVQDYGCTPYCSVCVFGECL